MTRAKPRSAGKKARGKAGMALAVIALLGAFSVALYALPFAVSGKERFEGNGFSFEYEYGNGWAKSDFGQAVTGMLAEGQEIVFFESKQTGLLPNYGVMVAYEEAGFPVSLRGLLKPIGEAMAKRGKVVEEPKIIWMGGRQWVSVRVRERQNVFQSYLTGCGTGLVKIIATAEEANFPEALEKASAIAGGFECV